MTKFCELSSPQITSVIYIFRCFVESSKFRDDGSFSKKFQIFVKYMGKFRLFENNFEKTSKVSLLNEPSVIFTKLIAANQQKSKERKVQTNSFHVTSISSRDPAEQKTLLIKLHSLHEELLFCNNPKVIQLLIYGDKKFCL